MLFTPLCLVSLACVLQAGSPDTLLVSDTLPVKTPLLLNGVEVRAVRADVDAPVSQSRVGRARIAEVQQGTEMPAMLERLVPSVQSTSDAGVASGYSYFRMRGIDQTRINVTLDGVPLNEPEDQGAYFSNFPDFAGNVASLQVQRGVGTSSHGVASFAGGLHFESARLATQGAGREAELGLGAFGTRQMRLQGSTGMLANGFALYGRLSGQETDGYRTHSGNRSGSVFLSGGYFGDESYWRATAIQGTTANEMAYLPSSQTALEQDWKHNPLGRDERDLFSQRLVSLTHARSLGDRSTLTLTGYHIGLRGDYDVAIDGLWNFNLASHWEGALAGFHTERGGTSLDVGAHASTYQRDHWLHIRPRMEEEVYRNQGERTEASGFVKVRQEMGRLGIFADAQVRHSSFKYQPSEGSGVAPEQISWNFFNPKIGASFTAQPGLQFYVSWGKSGREPTRNDLLAGFDDLDSTNVAFVGSFSRVHPEEVRDLEMGVRSQGEQGALQVNLFDMRFRNEIAPIGELSYIGLPLRKNVSRSERQGIEAEGSWDASSWLRLSGHATWMKGSIESYTDDATGETYQDVEPLLTPRLQSGHEADIQLAPSLSLRLAGRYVGSSYLDNTQREQFSIPASYTVSGQLSWVNQGMEFRLQGNNLTDKRVFTGGQTDGETSYYFVQAPRHLTASVRIPF